MANTEPILLLEDLKMSTVSMSKFELVERFGKVKLRKICKYRINQEYGILFECKHKNIVKVFEQDSDFSYLMEYCECGDLNSGEFKGNWSEVSAIFTQMCQAVRFLHNKGICHLDLKLANFVRNYLGTVKLIDFGHASCTQGLIRKVAGTREYNSPERYTGPFNGEKADVFSLGMCLVGLFLGFIPCCIGKQPFVIGSKFRRNKES